MKKLMIAAAIVCAAAFVQAASVEWKMGKNAFLYQDGKETTTSGHGAAQIYLFQVASTGFDSTFISGLESGTIDIDALTSQSGYVNTFSTGTSNTKKGGVDQNTITLSGAGQGETYYLAWIAVDKISGAADDTVYFYASDAKVATGWTSGDQTYTKDAAGVANWTSTMYSSANWHTVGDVPEPTSAMLLLLGVAGLALRRRRA